MEKISYTQRICKDRKKIDEFLIKKRVGILGMCDSSGKPYSLPINYIYLNKKIYIHGMGSGKKNTVIKENPSVCFTVFEEKGTVAAAFPCKCDTSYFSVIIFGKATLVKNINEKTNMLNNFVEKFMPKFFSNPLSPKFVQNYHSTLDNNTTAVYCIEPESLTAKENPIDPEHMFIQV